jgi:hypothetical protein
MQNPTTPTTICKNDTDPISIGGSKFELFKKRLHEGQKAFVQVTVRDNFARKYSFSFTLNSSRLRIIVILWSVSRDHAFGNEYKGIFS